MLDKDRIAQQLAVAHREYEPAITLIVRLLNDQEADSREPVKLLEVNPEQICNGELALPAGWTMGNTLYNAA